MPGSFREVNYGDFEDAVAKGVTLVEFWLPLSHPCLIQDPVLKDISGELGDGLRIIKINAADMPDLTQQYDVKAIPTLLLFQNGKEIKRFIGAQSKTILFEAINSLLVSRKSEG